ncbi:NAD-dependent epimerase/dehydratase family protein [Pseudomonas wadenswilerensis]|uniref:NAD-dependent epimerase/dehydratase family protein n=1 Tax=Pseudomonas wadenswilerensis TaxID=1785161 RepID=UPI00320A897B
MRSLVTGANGFIGRLLSSALLARGDEVVALTRQQDVGIPGVQCVQGDLTQPLSLTQGLLEGVDVIYHCAGELNDSDKMYPLHVAGTRNLLNLVHKHIEKTGLPVHWVQLSSVGAYGPGEGPADQYRSIDEASLPTPLGVYEVTKTIADELVVSLAGLDARFTFSLLRPSNVVGASMVNRSFFQMASMVRRRLFFYLGKGDAVATYVHVDDVVRALILCGTLKAAQQQIYLLSNDCPQRDLINAIADFYNVAHPTLRLPAGLFRWLIAVLPKGATPLTHARLDALLKRTTYSSSKIHSDLQFEFTSSIPDSIAELLGASSNRNSSV